MPATIRTSPNGNLVRIDVLPRLRIRNRIRDITTLLHGDDLVAWLVGCDIAVAEATIVVDEAAEWELRREVLGEGVEVHFFEGGEAVGHHYAWDFG